jgi:hypothetical protein
MVKPAAASTMIVAGFPSPATAGVAANFTVTLRDPYGNIATGYIGTVHFTSSDHKAQLPANYTFTVSDSGVHTFSAILRTPGTQSITATDTLNPSLTGTDGGITVVKGTKTNKSILSVASGVSAGSPVSISLTGEDASGNVIVSDTSMSDFSSTDEKTTLPSNYTFTAADNGLHTFTGLVLLKKGKGADKVSGQTDGEVITSI